MHRGFLLILLLTFTTLGGCIASETTVDDQWTPCSSGEWRVCRFDPEAGVLELNGREVEWVTFNQIALVHTVVPLNHVIVRNLTFEGARLVSMIDEDQCAPGCTIVLDNVTARPLAASGESSSADILVHVAGPNDDRRGHLFIKNSSLSSAGWAIVAPDLESVHIQNTRIHDNVGAMMLHGTLSIDLRKVIVENSSAMGYTAVGPGQVTVRDSTFRSNIFGMDEFAHNTDVESYTRIYNSTFEGNGQFGYQGASRDLQVSGSSFRDNGGVEGPIESSCDDAGLCITFGSAVVRNNIFEGNHAHGVHLGFPDIVIDARDNWWGHKNGPSIRSAGLGPTVGPPAYAGDGVTPGVQFYPWLDERPDRV